MPPRFLLILCLLPACRFTACSTHDGTPTAKPESTTSRKSVRHTRSPSRQFPAPGKRHARTTDADAHAHARASADSLRGILRRGHRAAVTSVVYSHDGRRIVSGSLDSTLRIWDRDSLTMLGPPLGGHVNAIRFLAITADDRFIVSGSADGSVRLWHLSDGHPGPELAGPIGFEAMELTGGHLPVRVLAAGRWISLMPPGQQFSENQAPPPGSSSRSP